MSCYFCGQPELIDFNTIIKVQVADQPRWLSVNNVPVCQNCWAGCSDDAQLAAAIVSSKLEHKDYSGLSYVDEDNPLVQLLKSME